VILHDSNCSPFVVVHCLWLFNGLYGQVLDRLVRIWIYCMSRHWRPILRLFSLFYLRFTFIAMTVKDYVYWTGYEIAFVGEAGEVISYLAISRAWG
jgi:hypothetical protein